MIVQLSTSAVFRESVTTKLTGMPNLQVVRVERPGESNFVDCDDSLDVFPPDAEVQTTSRPQRPVSSTFTCVLYFVRE